MSPQTIPNITLNNGRRIPQLGFGTLNVPPGRDSSAQRMAATADIVGQALELGYRHIDTAQMYGNERGVGEAIARSGLPREELWITSKLGNGNHRPEDVRSSFDESLNTLGLDYLDLFLVHWPLPTLYDGDYTATWGAMTDLLESGRLRSIGVSNFQPEHLDRIIDATGVTPAVNQIEVHPHFRNAAASDATRRHGIAVEAWSPLGQGHVLGDATIADIASDRGKTVAQIILRWHVQHDHILIPKSMHHERMRQNIEILDFELSDDDVDRIDSLDKDEGGRIGPHPERFDWIPDQAEARQP
jgi:2,5-diketo-D-gluconate reductase A